MRIIAPQPAPEGSNPAPSVRIPRQFPAPAVEQGARFPMNPTYRPVVEYTEQEARLADALGEPLPFARDIRRMLDGPDANPAVQDDIRSALDAVRFTSAIGDEVLAARVRSVLTCPPPVGELGDALAEIILAYTADWLVRQNSQAYRVDVYDAADVLLASRDVSAVDDQAAMVAAAELVDALGGAVLAAVFVTGQSGALVYVDTVQP